MIDKICRFGTAFLGALGAIELFAWFCEQCKINVAVAPTTFCFILAVLTAVWFLIDGLCVSGFLIRRVTIKMPHIRTNINIFIGDLLSQGGCAIVPANDFFDNVVNEDLVAAKSIDGQMIKRFWGGNISGMDAEALRQLEGETYEAVGRDAPAKTRRYKLGTSIVLKASEKLRIIWVALTTTDVATNKTHADLDDLALAIRAALIKARNRGNGDVLNIPLMGGGLSRTGMNSAFLLNLLIGIIVDESKKQSITESINIVLTKSALEDINLLEVKRNWEA